MLQKLQGPTYDLLWYHSLWNIQLFLWWTPWEMEMEKKEDLLHCLRDSQKQSQNQNFSFKPWSPSLVQDEKPDK